MRATLLAAAGLCVISCAGQDGVNGANGSLVDIQDEPAGDNCAAGGQRIQVGVDADRNGTLDEGEIESTTYVCNGAAAAEVLVVVTQLAPGGECQAGGERVDIGQDDGEGTGTAGNGVLEDDEIDESVVLCLPCQGNLGVEEVFEANGKDVFEGTPQTFVVPDQVCAIRITAAGAEGGSSTTEGALIEGTVPVTPGQEIAIVVGQQGRVGETLSPLFGGGGTFVVDAAGNPLVIAGGGGSCFFDGCDPAETVGRAVTSGGAPGDAVRADNGEGGGALNTTSGGGGGLLTGGANPTGGAAYVDGASGASGETFGGYGGGGARGGSFGQGGGGGYSGGSCGDLDNAWVGCGGGGSFNAGVGQVNLAGVNEGDGYVTITY